jgi:hypothetical protein
VRHRVLNAKTAAGQSGAFDAEAIPAGDVETAPHHLLQQ